MIRGISVQAGRDTDWTPAARITASLRQGGIELHQRSASRLLSLGKTCLRGVSLRPGQVAVSSELAGYWLANSLGVLSARDAGGRCYCIPATMLWLAFWPPSSRRTSVQALCSEGAVETIPQKRCRSPCQSARSRSSLRSDMRIEAPLKTTSQSTPLVQYLECARAACRYSMATEIDAITGLRRSELLGLKWSDVDFVGLEVNVTRSAFRQVVVPCKTEASKRPLPLDP